MFHFQGYTLDVARGSLRAADREIELRPKSFEVLRYLVENADRLVTKEELIKAIWPNVIVNDEALTHCVSEVRQAIGDGKQATIKTVRSRGYRFTAPVSQLAIDDALDLARATTPQPIAHSDIGRPLDATVSDRRSIAVLAFVNLTGNPHEEYFSDGVTEDIITELSRFSELMVIARNSTFQYKGKAVDIRQIGRELNARYVLEGSVRREGDRVRITAQLIDVATGAHRWAERYDRQLSKVFAVQDDLTRAIVTTLAVHVTKAESERTLLKPAATWEAYDYYLRGAEAYFSHIREPKATPLSEGRRLLEKSVSIDPSYARAYAMLARTWVHAFWDPLNHDFLDPACTERAHELACKAVRLEDSLPLAHFQLGMALLFKRHRDEAVAEFERAFALNPNYTEYQLGYGLALAGQAARGVELLQDNIRLDPFGFPSRVYHLGQALYMLGRYAQAVPLLRQCASRLPTVGNNYLFLAATHAQLGQFNEAKAAVSEALCIYPAYTIEKLTRALPFNEPRDADHLADGLRKAGLPES